MSSFRFHVALAAAKLSKGLIQLLGRNGTHTPGVIALKICPDFLAQAPKAPLTICVTGTNGKTTCSNLITDVLEKDGRRVVSNRTGSNIVPGCTTNVINSLTFTGKVRVDATVFEVDERPILTVALQNDAAAPSAVAAIGAAEGDELLPTEMRRTGTAVPRTGENLHVVYKVRTSHITSI